MKRIKNDENSKNKIEVLKVQIRQENLNKIFIEKRIKAMSDINKIPNSQLSQENILKQLCTFQQQILNQENQFFIPSSIIKQLIQLRQIIAVKNPPVKDFINSQILPYIFSILNQNITEDQIILDDNNKEIFESDCKIFKKQCLNDLYFNGSWILQNLVSLDEETTSYCINLGIIEPLISLLSNNCNSTRAQAIQALSNISLDSKGNGDILINKYQVLEQLFKSLENYTGTEQIYDSISSLFQGITLFYSQQENYGKIDSEILSQILDILSHVQQECVNNPIISSKLLKSLCNIIQCMNSDQICDFIKSDYISLVNDCIALINNKPINYKFGQENESLHYDLYYNSWQVIYQMSLFHESPEVINQLIQKGIVKIIKQTLSQESNIKVLSEVLKIIHKLILCSNYGCDIMIEQEFIPIIDQLFGYENGILFDLIINFCLPPNPFQIKILSVQIITDTIQNCNLNLLQELLTRYNVIEILINFLDIYSQEDLLQILNIIYYILQLEQNKQIDNQIKNLLLQFNAKEKIYKLIEMESNNNQITQISNNILNKFFD